jgi:hypothetical protein
MSVKLKRQLDLQEFARARPPQDCVGFSQANTDGVRYDSAAHGAAEAEQTQDRFSPEGTSSAVRKRVKSSFPRFRNSENVEVACWRCAGKTRIEFISTFREFSKHGSSFRNEGEHGSFPLLVSASPCPQDRFLPLTRHASRLDFPCRHIAKIPGKFYSRDNYGLGWGPSLITSTRHEHGSNPDHDHSSFSLQF